MNVVYFGETEPGPPTSNGLVSLILGVLGIALCPLTAPVAIWLARDVRRRYAPSHDQAKLAQAGLILGWIGVALLSFQVVMMTYAFTLMFVTLANG